MAPVDFYLAMQDQEDSNTHDALFHAAVGRLVLQYAQLLDYDVVKTQVETEATRLIARIYEILQDETLQDSDCCLKIDEIVTAYYQHLDLSSTRHLDWE